MRREQQSFEMANINKIRPYFHDKTDEQWLQTNWSEY